MKKTLFIFELILLLGTLTVQADDRYFVGGKGESSGKTAPGTFDCDENDNQNIISKLTASAKVNADNDARKNCAQLNFTLAEKVKDYDLSLACLKFGSIINIHAHSTYQCK